MKKYLPLLFLIFFSCEKNPVEPGQYHYEWKTAEPEMQGFDINLLDSAFIQADATGYMDGLLVIRNGLLVAESYYNGYYVNTPHNVKSVSKSFLAVITGKALEQNYISDLSEKVLDYFPEYISPGIDERKYNITLGHLLTMQMGIRGEAEDNYQVYQQNYYAADWIKYTLEMPLVFDPGTSMRYNTFQTHLLSAILTKATGLSMIKYASVNIFTPMGIDVDDWQKDPQGYYFGGNNMYFTPREMAVLGLLYLRSGEINGLQIVSQEWIDRTLTKTRPQNMEAWGVFTDYNYGYLWWLGKINNFTLYMALGYGGQTVLIFPQLDLIVVTTAEEKIPPDIDQIRPILALVSRYILKAVQS